MGSGVSPLAQIEEARRVVACKKGTLSHSPASHGLFKQFQLPLNMEGCDNR